MNTRWVLTRDRSKVKHPPARLGTSKAADSTGVPAGVRPESSRVGIAWSVGGASGNGRLHWAGLHAPSPGLSSARRSVHLLRPPAHIRQARLRAAEGLWAEGWPQGAGSPGHSCPCAAWPGGPPPHAPLMPPSCSGAGRGPAGRGSDPGPWHRGVKGQGFRSQAASRQH